MSNLKLKVMRRVYAFWFLRTAYHSLALKIVGISLLGLVLRELVSLRSVIMNTMQTGGVDRMFSYLEYAFTHTTISVQLILVLIGALALWTIVDAIKKDFPLNLQSPIYS